MRLLRWTVAVAAVAAFLNAAFADAAPGGVALPGTGLADTLLIAGGGTLVGVALIAAVVLWRRRV
jgi:hypothetical protein